MTSNDSVRDDEIIFKAAKDGKWRKVFQMYKEKKELRTVKVSSTGDTILHLAVSSGKWFIVSDLVYLVGPERSNEQEERENGDEKEQVFGAQNEKGNTPLHLAASASGWSFRMCEEIGGANPSIITRVNNDGETPLFLAALHGNKEAFLWLHYHSLQDSSSHQAHYKRKDNDTILHCAIEGGHIDVGIEIVHLYKQHIKDMTMTLNKNGFSPLHVLAATPSAFESTDLPSRFFVVQLLYRFLRVKTKQQATTMEELEQRKWKRYENDICDFFFSCATYLIDDLVEISMPCCIAPIECLIVIPLRVLAWVLVVLLKFSNIFIFAANWFHGIRKMRDKHAWSLQILEILLQQYENKPAIIEYNEEGSKIVDPPLMIAAKNGVIEMVKKILELFWMNFWDVEGKNIMNVLDDEGKNIVLLAAEKRQTKVYQLLYRHDGRNLAFRQVDKDGNTALHLAAKPGINLYGHTTTMVEEFKWFQFVKNSVPYELWERYNKEGKTAEEIFRDSYKGHMTRDRKWLDQTSQACSVASTLVASMAFSNFAGENIKKKNDSSLVALSLSLTSTISFLAILAFRSESLNFWKYVPFMLHIAILTMFSSIVALWISLMFHGHSRTTCAILGSPIAILTIVSLPIFIGPTLMSMFNEVPPPNRNTTNAIQYQRPQKKENGVDKDQKPTPNPTFEADVPIQDTTRSPDDMFKEQKDEGGFASFGKQHVRDGSPTQRCIKKPNNTLCIEEL